MDRHRFTAVLESIPLIAWGAGTVAFLLPLAELSVALLLLYEKTRLAALYASFLMLSAFTAYLIYMVLFLPHLPCSCGGVISGLGWKPHIVFNLACLGLTAAGIRSERKERFMGPSFT